MVAGGWWAYQELFSKLPDVNEIYNPPKMSTKILDRTGKLLYKFYEGENRSWVPLEKVPQTLIWATLAIEDKDFYRHRGLSIRGIIKALWHNLIRGGSSGEIHGGSTITQQLVKNVFFDKKKTWERKIKEAIMAVLVERKLSKEEILERYFNQVAYGGETYGIQEASQKYFGKNVWEIDTAQAAFLAGLPAAPSSYSPYGDGRDFAFRRQGQVIEQMVAAKYISTERGGELKKEKINLTEEKRTIQAPHFVFYIKNLMEQRFGYTNFGRQGLTVTTTLDLEIQGLSEKILKEEMEKIRNLRISNGAAIVLGVKSGDILAMVGSKDYYSTAIDGKFNVTTALRQPGSAIKPINYLLSLQGGMTLSSLIDDSPVTYEVRGQKPYSPQNYNGKFMGRVTVRTALASSLNVPSVKLLAVNGVENMINLGERMGITTWKDRSRFGLSLALGGGEVKMIDLAQAYSIFANMGNKVVINPILGIDNYLGEALYRREIETEQVMGSEYTYLINNVLSDDTARAPIFGLNSKLKIEGKTVAVKTGTTNNLRDNWCIGWSPSVLAATWVGNNDGTPMSWVASGVTGATPIWNRIMRGIISDRPNENWERPEKIEERGACGRKELFVAGTGEEVTCAATVTPTP